MCNEINLLYALFILCIILLILSCKKSDNFENLAYPEGAEGEKDSGVYRICDSYGNCVSRPKYFNTDTHGTPSFAGTYSLGFLPGSDYPESSCDLNRLHTGDISNGLGSPLDPTSLSFPEIMGYFSSGSATAFPPAVMSAVRSRDSLIHAGWRNMDQPGALLTETDRKPLYKYQVGSSIQVVS